MALVIPLLPFEKFIIAHAVLCVIGFLGLLPLGAILARYTRTYTPRWFTAHWVVQFAIAGPVIVVGVAMGANAVTLADSGPVNDVHKRWGMSIFVLYLAQLAFGASIHFFKPKAWAQGSGRRPFQNYFHAVCGLLIIAFAMFQVRTGFRTEWPVQTGRGPISNGANGFWYFWIVILPIVYFGGLVLLARQFRQEKQAREGSSSSTELKQPISQEYEPRPATEEQTGAA